MSGASVLATDFIKAPSLYLGMVKESSITITQDGSPIAMLVRADNGNPIATIETSDTPITDGLIGILKDTGIQARDEIKEMRLGA